MTKVSIITVCKNNLRGLKSTLESVFAQSCPPFECIVIDGNSTDGTQEFLLSLNIPCLTSISEPDQGIYQAMNKGLKLATGDYVFFLNSGDTFASNDSLSSIIPKLGISDIQYGDVLLSKNGSILGEKHHPGQNELSVHYFLYETICQQAIFYSRSIFKTPSPFMEHYLCSDWLFLLQCLLIHGNSYTHLGLTISNYDLSGISTTASERVEKERTEILQSYFPLLAPLQKRISFLENVWASKGIPTLYSIHLFYRKFRSRF